MGDDVTMVGCIHKMITVTDEHIEIYMKLIKYTFLIFQSSKIVN